MLFNISEVANKRPTKVYNKVRRMTNHLRSKQTRYQKSQLNKSRNGGPPEELSTATKILTVQTEIRDGKCCARVTFAVFFLVSIAPLLNNFQHVSEKTRDTTAFRICERVLDNFSREQTRHVIQYSALGCCAADRYAKLHRIPIGAVRSP